MKKTRILSLLLCAVLFCTLAVPATTAYAEEEPTDSGMVLSKTAAANGDGTYTITLEAYATGEKTISTETKDVPTDIVLVLDLSSSMSRDIGTVSYSAYSNKNNEELYAKRHNGGEGNLWYKVNDSYYSVSVTVEGKTASYTDASRYSNGNLYNNRNNLYAKIGEEYVKVTVERSGRYNYTYTYTYTYNASTVTKTSSGQNSRPTFDTGVSLWVLNGVDTTNAVYTYTYTDSSGTKTITTSTGGTTVPSGAIFYSRSESTSGGGTRLAALKEACNTFAEEVAEKAKGADDEAGTADDVKHRIAIVGFNSSSTRYTGTSAATALIDMSTSTGESTVKTAVTKLTTSQGTVPATGLSTANDIFAANSIPVGETRNRVVIFFTDGYPSTSGADNFDMTLANNAITQASTAKNTHGATVYSIAVITGADPTSEGNKDGTNQEKVNWYLHTVSSNNGKPQTPSYYLSAADADSLKNIFQQISQQIETGGSASTLTDEAVVRDIVSPYFALPSDATVNDITLESYAYHGPNQAWTKNETALGATASLDKVKDEETGVEQNRVSVTGFNFSENWCGTESQTGTTGDVSYRGNKLVIRFKVTPSAGFLGGNGVQTNNGAGVYENKDATTPVESVDAPTVDVAIKQPNVSVPGANVYLGAYFTETVSAEALKAGTAVSFGTGDDVVTLDMSMPNNNWGLASWQNEYVDIAVVVKDESGNEVTEFSDLRNDTKYTVSVTIKPKGAASGDDSSASGTIHVFKPELTYKDTTAYYGESVPENNDYSGNMVGEAKWKNGDKYSTDAGVTMLGSQTPPTLDISYTPDSEKIFDGKYGKEDVPVKATVKIGTEDVTDDTTFVHTPCEQGEELPSGAQFLIHIKTCTLTVTKQGGAANESYVFDVYKDNAKYSEVTIWGNGTAELVELPIGTYTIKENAGWSWRYTANNGSEVELKDTSPSGTITCTNTKANEKWFNGYSTVVSNVIGQ